ncbi:MAG: hypothetical protein IAF58_09905 [Leptolyngbya sp.]|nr:hypothetical protein [Candidatus Melainabacteria bacterium]
MFEKVESAQAKEISKTSESMSFGSIMKDVDPRALENSNAVCTTKTILPNIEITKCVTPLGSADTTPAKPSDEFDRIKPVCLPGPKPERDPDKYPDKYPDKELNKNSDAVNRRTTFGVVNERAYGPH